MTNRPTSDSRECRSSDPATAQFRFLSLRRCAGRGECSPISHRRGVLCGNTRANNCRLLNHRQQAIGCRGWDSTTLHDRSSNSENRAWSGSTTGSIALAAVRQQVIPYQMVVMPEATIWWSRLISGRLRCTAVATITRSGSSGTIRGSIVCIFFATDRRTQHRPALRCLDQLL